MKTSNLFKLVTGALTIGSVILSATNTNAQLYSSGNNFISTDFVGIGTNTPEAQLEINNRIVPAATCGTCQSLPASVQPALTLTSELVANPPNSGTSEFYTWTIDAEEKFVINEENGSSLEPVLEIDNEETSIYSKSTFLTPDIQVSVNNNNSTPNYTLGLGISCDNGAYESTQTSSTGAVFRSRDGDLKLYTGVTNSNTPFPRLTVKSTGQIGIGTADPSHSLEVNNGDVQFRNGEFEVKNGDMHVLNGDMQVDNGGIQVYDGDLRIQAGKFIVAGANGTNEFQVKANGYVVAREILVDINEAIPDYVFDEEYNLMEIDDLRQYLKDNHHLPNIPSAKEFEDQGGIELGELTRLLLEKQEELLLYVLQLEDEIDLLNAKIGSHETE